MPSPRRETCVPTQRRTKSRERNGRTTRMAGEKLTTETNSAPFALQRLISLNRGEIGPPSVATRPLRLLTTAQRRGDVVVRELALDQPVHLGRAHGSPVEAEVVTMLTREDLGVLVRVLRRAGVERAPHSAGDEQHDDERHEDPYRPRPPTHVSGRSRSGSPRRRSARRPRRAAVRPARFVAAATPRARRPRASPWRRAATRPTHDHGSTPRTGRRTTARNTRPRAQRRAAPQASAAAARTAPPLHTRSAASPRPQRAAEPCSCLRGAGRGCRAPRRGPCTWRRERGRLRGDAPVAAPRSVRHHPRRSRPLPRRAAPTRARGGRRTRPR